MMAQAKAKVAKPKKRAVNKATKKTPAKKPAPKAQASASKESALKESALKENYPREDSTEDKKAPVTAAAPKSEKKHSEPVDSGESDLYATSIYFDKRLNSFVGTVLEFPEMKIKGESRDQVMDDLFDAIEKRLEEENVPEPLQMATYPDNLDVPISQGLYRKLDQLSRQERVALDALVSELLSAGISRRENRQPSKGQQSARPANKQGQPQRNNAGGNPRRGGGQRGGGQRGPNSGNQRHGNNNRDGNRRYGGNTKGSNYGQQPAGDNFLEYVRSLEKGGFKKR